MKLKLEVDGVTQNAGHDFEVHGLNKRKSIDSQEVPLQLYEYSGTVEKVTTSDKLQSLSG